MSDAADAEAMRQLLDDGLDVFAAFIAKQEGLDALRTVLTQAVKAKCFKYREALEDAAAKLDEHDLNHVADVLLDFAADQPSEIEASPWIENSLAERPHWPHPRQAKIWATRFLMRRQAETGRHIIELADWYRQFAPYIGDYSKYAGQEGYAWSRMRERPPVLREQDRD
jgi:hypothetical protein